MARIEADQKSPASLLPVLLNLISCLFECRFESLEVSIGVSLDLVRVRTEIKAGNTRLESLSFFTTKRKIAKTFKPRNLPQTAVF